MTERTFTMIKPQSIKNNHFGQIFSMITGHGFRVVGMKMIHLTPKRAGLFYEIHRDRPFFKKLVKAMTSGPVIVAVLEKENAVLDFRSLIGSTNPLVAEEGTIRKIFGSSIDDNGIHGSDSLQTAEMEINFHFASSELF